jgi:Tol biopolymer transport system component
MLKIVGIVVGLGILLVIVGLVLITRSQNKPAKVPSDFEEVQELPPTAGTASDATVFFDSDRSGNFELYRMTTEGTDVTPLTDDPHYDSWWPRLSPDRTRIAFHRSPKGVHDTDFKKVSLWMVNIDGSHLVQLRPPGLDGWAQQGHVEWFPGGRSLVLFGGSKTNPQIYVTDATGRSPRRLTHRGGTNIDPSVSPDGKTVAFVGCPGSICTPGRYEIYTIGVDGNAKVTRLTRDGLRDHDPYYSPDGTRIAWLTQTSTKGLHPGGSWNIRIANADGTGLRRLTDDHNINSKPDWSADGSVIYFHRLDVRNAKVFSIFAIEADGSGLREVTPHQPGVNEFPTN